ncbi:MAG: dTMP kinase [Chloroflexi bacterium]|nr:MAG: dTMP kinase [Chloroflexota bacterium]MBL1193004.1 dTMP kinase [Chloroflexota bacterium]NOH10297.1 dTMP kinase [Chloroflexota bacterium]
MFITLEGPDGSGKTSQIDPLVKYLEQQDFHVVPTREPGGTDIGDQVRKVIMDLRNKAMHPSTEILLFQSSRAQLVNEVIRPSLVEGKVVLCDRYADSTIAYQGYGHQVNLKELQAIIQFATGGLKPDLTIFLDITAEVGLQRNQKSGKWNRLDDYDLAFHERVYKGYQTMMAEDPERWVVVDGTQPPEKVQEDMRRAILERLAQKVKSA